jgi:hypothetical protein
VELLTGRGAFGPPTAARRSYVLDALSGRAELPWEMKGPGGTSQGSASLQELRALRKSVLACLDRDPAKRPSASRLEESWNGLFDMKNITLTV